jgi:hypothetical protein
MSSFVGNLIVTLLFKKLYGITTAHSWIPFEPFQFHSVPHFLVLRGLLLPLYIYVCEMLFISDKATKRLYE